MIRGGSLTDHIAVAYSLGIAFALLALVFVGGLALHVGRVAVFRNMTIAISETVVSRERVEGAPQTREDLQRLVARTSFPGFEMGVVAGSRCYWVTWPERSSPSELPPPAVVRPDPTCRQGIASDWLERTASILGGYSSPLTMLGTDLIKVSPMSATFAREVQQTLAAMMIAAIIAIVIALWAGRRIALHVMSPVRALKVALDATQLEDVTLRNIPEVGDTEVGRLIASITRFADIKAQAVAELKSANEHTHEFVADAGHQLRTPLSVLRGFTGILRSNKLRHPDDAPKILEKMDAQIGRMTQLVESLMLLESLQLVDGSSAEVTDIGALTSEIVAPLSAMDPTREVRIDVVEGACARVNPTEFGHAVTNVVANAFKYAKDGAIEIAVTADCENVYVSVRDDGPGMSADVLAHVFDRFYRGPRRDVPGSGLGLAIAKRAAERANGSIIAESTEGAGSRFLITLPRDANKCQFSIDRQIGRPALSSSA